MLYEFYLRFLKVSQNIKKNLLLKLSVHLSQINETSPRT